MNIKENLIHALRGTFIADSLKLKETTAFLKQSSEQTGYCMALMEIVDDQDIDINLKQAALIQLKNTIKLRWKSKKIPLDIEEKTKIKNILLIAIIRCANSFKLIKLYKQIIAIVIGHQYKQGIPLNAVFEKIRNNQDTIPIMHYLIAISTTFQFSITDEQRNQFFKFLIMVLPNLYALMQINQNSQLIYLCVKFLWKAVHYEIDEQVKLLIIDWMPLIHALVNLTKPEFQSNTQNYQQRDTPEFYYFHSKKWATRILFRFIQRHAKLTFIKKNQNNRQFSQNWYNNFGKLFIDALVYQFSIPTVNKVRYFQLKCLHSLIIEKPQALQQYAELFQYDILLKFMKLKPEDESLANTDPIQFLNREQQPSVSFTNLKRVATDAWVAYAQTGSQTSTKNESYKPGIFFFNNINYLKNKLQGNNPVQKELAMYLICQLRSAVMKCAQIKAILPNLITNYIIPEFKNQIMFLRARAVDIFQEYGTMDFSIELITMASSGIYWCLTKDVYNLVRIKAATAFNCILKHKSAKQLVKPYLKDVLTIYLELLEKYDLQSLVNSLQSIVANFSTQIGPFATDLGKYLSRLFIKLFNKDIEQSNNDNYDGQAEMAAAGCLKTISQILQSPIQQSTIKDLEMQVLELCEFTFASDAVDYYEDILIILNAYLFKIESISPWIQFYYQVVVYNIVGIPKQRWPLINQLPISDKQKKIFNNIKAGGNIEMIEQSMPVLRNYIQKGSLSIIQNQDAFSINLLELLFYLINQVYKIGPNDFSGEIEMNCGTALLIYLLQNNQNQLPQPIYVHIWLICKHNCTKMKTKTLKILNSQLLSLLFWVVPKIVIMYAQAENIFPIILRELVNYQNKYEQQHERQRMILGMSTLLTYPERNQQLLLRFPQIFKILTKLVHKNCDEIIGTSKQKNQNNKNNNELQDLDENFDDLQFDSEDCDQFWQEMYGDNYSSKLDQIDEIQYFSTCINKIRNQQPLFYQQMIKIISFEELQNLDLKVQTVININQLK